MVAWVGWVLGNPSEMCEKAGRRGSRKRSAGWGGTDKAKVGWREERGSREGEKGEAPTPRNRGEDCEAELMQQMNRIRQTPPVAWFLCPYTPLLSCATFNLKRRNTLNAHFWNKAELAWESILIKSTWSTAKRPNSKSRLSHLAAGCFSLPICKTGAIVPST